MLVHKSYDFIKPRQLFESIGQLLGIGILLAEDEEHKVQRIFRPNGGLTNQTEQMQRKNLMPAFHFRHIKDLYPVFWSKSCEMAKALSQISQPEGTKPVQDLKYAPVVEIGNWMSRVTLDIIGVAGMGYDFNAIQDPTTELISTYRSVFSPSRQAQVLGFISLLLPFWLVRALPFQRNFQVVKAVRTIRRICRQVIDKKKEELEGKDKHVGIDILSVALKSGCFTQENLVDQMMTFLAAGHETTATSMIWAIYLLCQHPDIQTRLREEIRGNLPSINDAENTVTAQVFDRLPFLHAVCNEVFRVHPAVPLTVRESAKDTSILGTFVPKGTRIIMAPQATNMAAPLWGPEPEKFDPDRWMGNGRANTGGADSNYAFLTFLHGPRSCIGQSFAKAEFACLLAALVGRFEFELEDPDRKIEIKGGITAKPKDGLPIRIRLMDGW